MAIEKRPFAEEVPVSSIVLRWEGIFDFDGMYKYMQSWLANKEYEFHEAAYKHKPAELGKEIELEWFAEKKINGYAMNRIDVEMHLWDVNEVEVEGKKLTRARMWIKLSATLILDYEQKWGKNAFYSALRNFFHKHIIKKQIDFVWAESLRLELNKFLEDIKAYLESMARGKVY